MKRKLKTMHVVKRICLFLMIVMLTNMCAGCWDRVEIDKLAYVTIVGIDSAGPDGVLVTFQTVIPRMLAKGQAGGGGGGAPAKPYTNYSVQARNVSDAVHLFELKNPHAELFKTANVIIIGEELARQSVVPPLDFFTRKPMMRRTMWVLLAKGRAEDILLKVEPGPESIPVNNITSMYHRRQDVSMTTPVNFGQFLSMLERPGLDPIIPMIKLAPELSGTTTDSQGGNQTFEISDLGAFKQNKMVSFIGTSESRGLFLVQGKVQGGTITVPATQGSPWASLLVSSIRSKITPIITQDGIRFKIEIKVASDLSSVQNEELDLTKPEDILKLEQEEEKAIQQEVMSAVKKSQELHSDFLGFGEKIYETNPGLWKELEEEWHDEWLPNVQVDLSVSCKIKGNGLTAEPVKPVP